MKFLSKEKVTVEDKELKIKLTMKYITNEMRFTIWSLMDLTDSDEDGAATTSDAALSRLKLGTYLFTDVATHLSIRGETIPPAKMPEADLTDTESASDYFKCVEIMINKILGVGDGANDEVKK